MVRQAGGAGRHCCLLYFLGRLLLSSGGKQGVGWAGHCFSCLGHGSARAGQGESAAVDMGCSHMRVYLCGTPLTMAPCMPTLPAPKASSERGPEIPKKTVVIVGWKD